MEYHSQVQIFVVSLTVLIMNYVQDGYYNYISFQNFILKFLLKDFN